MTVLDELREQLNEIDRAEGELHQRRAQLLRAFVKEAGGLTEAAGLLELDPRVVVQRQRLEDLAMVIYRGGAGTGTDADGRVYGETGQDDAAQRLADGRWWRVAQASRRKIRLLIVVDRGQVRRIWPVREDVDIWEESADSRVAFPLGERPLTQQELDARYPALGICLGDHRPARRGLLREYVPIDGASANPRTWVLSPGDFDPNDPSLRWTPPAGSLT
ncbi:hypothetical protein OHA38_43365 (plasmid) [Streptomyces sp. NBC_01732]|uniref:hypothetical protein n=1 Tax=Streptomyces sp. NBC_01732 TaxID=2975926 RepID=UPI00352F20C4|nr:hypothetical protein OHA38_43365 [Streptomyces sp. NBC_01732]